MKGFLICTGKRAEHHPLYIYETKTNIYSVEELCYYIYNNIETLDEMLFNTGMADFFERCDRPKLAEYLKNAINSEEVVSVEEVICHILSEVNYYDRQEIEALCLRIRKLAAKPSEERLKVMGDALLKNGRYAMAEKKYKRLVDMKKNESLPAEFYGSVWHNLGVIYAKMMYFELAAECFSTAYSIYPAEQYKKSLFMAYTFAGDKESLEKLSKNEPMAKQWEDELGLKMEETGRVLGESGEVSRLLTLYRNGEIAKYHDGINALIDKWKTEYREQTK